jgi:outer membrane protein OmpA-like peptidoglycan-associated protein
MSLGACATVGKPAELTQAESIYQRLQVANAESRIAGEMLRAREAITAAQAAVESQGGKDYLNGVSHIALRAAQTAEAVDERNASRTAADSLEKARLVRLSMLTDAQRAQLAEQKKLSAAEIAALQQQNQAVSQQADSLRLKADSLRRANEAANEALNAALGQLRTLVVEITNLKETSRGLVISLSDILFDVDKATLKPGAEQNLRRIAAILKQYPDKQIVVEGHTDSDGSDAYNMKLSEDRAASVRSSLIAGGVAESLISSRGFGESQPVATNDTREGKQQNRRVEVIVLGAGTVADAAAKVPPN